MKYQIVRKSVSGFSLTELLIVLVIISVLVLLALPKLMPLVTRAKMKEAQIALATIKSLQKAYKLEHDTYSPDLLKIGFEHEPLISEGGQARYQFEMVSADAQSFEATATSLVDFDNDGIFNIWRVTENGMVEEVIPD